MAQNLPEQSQNEEKHIISPDALKAYLASIRDIPVLDREAERVLARRAKAGDKKAWDLFIRSNLRFVVKIANRYKGCGVSMSDLIHEGNIGLIEAAERFDPERGFRFITYAVWWISQAMASAIASQGGAVRLTVNQARKRLKVRDMLREMEQATGEEPNIDEVADAVGELPEEVAAFKAGREGLSLNAPVGGTDGTTHIDFLTDGHENAAEESLDRMAISQHLSRALAKLPKREGDILRMRFGFDGEPMTLQKVGDHMNLSRERIRQLENTALRLLQKQDGLGTLRDMLKERLN